MISGDVMHEIPFLPPEGANAPRIIPTTELICEEPNYEVYQISQTDTNNKVTINKSDPNLAENELIAQV